MCNALYNIYNTELKKKKNRERNEKHVFVSDEELEEEARVLKKARKKTAIVATSVHETANLSDSDGPVCTIDLREESSDGGPKFEI